MNSTDSTPESSRPFGYWLKATDRLMAAEFAAAFESFGITRRDWRLLNRIDGTVADARPLPEHKLGRLIELGWVTRTDGAWTLSDEGRDAKERLGSIVDGIRAKVADAVPADDLETTIRTLEQLARAFGWDESTPLPRGRRRGGHGRGRGHGGHGRHRHGGPGHHDGHSPHGHGDEAPHFGSWHRGAHDFDAREFGHHLHDGRHVRLSVPPFGGSGAHGYRPGHGYEPDRGYGPDHRGGVCRDHEHSFGVADPHAWHEHGHHDHSAGMHQRGHQGDVRARRARKAQSAFERGFDAGFARGHGDR